MLLVSNIFQKLAKMIQDKYRQQSSDTASFVTYTITGVWIGNEVTKFKI